MSDKIQDVEKKYGHLVVVAFCLSLLLIVVFWAFFSHWFNQRLLSDFWPIDKSTVAPNLLASLIIFDVATLAAALFYPPFKKLLDRSFQVHKDELKDHITSELSEVHAKMDHIIRHHPDIPAYKGKK
jgi:uncharacterized membrane protein